LQWSVTCPNRVSSLHKNTYHSWALKHEELIRVGNDLKTPKITCQVCQKSFSLIEGVRESFVSEHPFLIHDFQSNLVHSGTIKGKVGLAVKVTFPKPFDLKPDVYITPATPTSMATSNVDTTGFFLHASKLEENESDEFECGWSAFGTIKDSTIPLWRKLITNAKNAQLRHDNRLQVVELEAVFELFASDYVLNSLRSKGIREETIEWISRRNIVDLLSIWFREATGNKAPVLYKPIHSKWSKAVKELRDAVVHRGKEDVTPEQVQEARGAVFDYMIAINTNTIYQFQVA
jgi:hypothetical protein